MFLGLTPDQVLAVEVATTFQLFSDRKFNTVPDLTQVAVAEFNADKPNPPPSTRVPSVPSHLTIYNERES